jgi:hypothetical protein
MKYQKCSDACARAMILWLVSRVVEDGCRDIVRPFGRRGWEARQDWLMLFVQTAEYRQIHAQTQDNDPEVIALRRRLEELGWPETFGLPDLGAQISTGRRIAGLLLFLGYAPDRNPADRQGRWMCDRVRIRRYRRVKR